MSYNALVKYGISEESAQYRIHVCVHVKQIYVYERTDVLPIIDNYPDRSAFTDKVLTAKGKIIPITEIPELQTVGIPEDYLNEFPITRNDSTSNKGNNAVFIAKKALISGLIRLKLYSEIIDDKTLQIEGADIIITNKIIIQVKCDYYGGDKRLGGTGNLFIQTHERNLYMNY